MIKTFVLMGLPGSGKGKQSELLNAKTGYPVASTGGKLREIVKGGGVLGKKVAEVMNSGELMPSWFVEYIFQQALFETKEDGGIIFEGVGRMEPEARLFADVCNWLERDFRIIHLNVSEEASVLRLKKRRELEGRLDDDPTVVTNRFRNFYENTMPSIEFFHSIGKVIEIDGEPLPDKVFEEIWGKISVL